MQERYWNYMQQVKMWIFYFEIYSEELYKSERICELFFVTISSVFVVIEAVWTDSIYICGMMIILTNLINFLKSKLIFDKQQKAISNCLGVLRTNFYRAESAWYNIKEGRLTEIEINERLYNLKKGEEFLDMYLSDVYLPDKDKYSEKADAKKNDYFEKNF